ncbi:MAG: peptide ABC transporter substrate-binding protein [Butyrivibrio sp.]|nr:peptide ABC transporter substrate-binding protein [Muribaculum sp.]MCM1551254.1 peptide ABC transporter substrate-binding protein [Butyrivibrio sp.]
MKRLWKKIVALVLTSSIVVGLSACAGTKESSSSKASQAADGTTYKVITTYTSPEDGTLDAAGNVGYWWWYYNAYATAPLVELAEDGSYKYIAAESVDINDDMTEFTFHIRENANWNNGDALTSQDFYNTITRALDPSCGNGYSSMLFSIMGASDIYNNGADMNKLGVECVDEKTIKFTLVSTTPYFMDMLALPVYTPTHRTLQTETNGSWAMGEDLEALVSCGPFYMAEYVPSQYFVFKRNADYVLADEIKLDEIKHMVMDDTQAIINAYKTGELDVASADYTVLEEYEGKDDLYITDTIVSNYELFDITEPPFDDIRVREAFAISVDRDAVATACGANYIGSTFFVAPKLVSKASGKTWAEEAGGELLAYDPERAKELLAEAGYPDGDGFPTVTYKYPSQQLESDIAQALQAQWKEKLGIEIQLEAQEYQVNVADRRAGDFELCRMQWTADFADPFSYLAMYMSTDTYNDNGTSCEKYDELMNQSMLETDTQKRFELMHEAERVLVSEYFWGVPVLARESINLVNPKITNRVIDPSRGLTRYKYADLVTE